MENENNENLAHYHLNIYDEKKCDKEGNIKVCKKSVCIFRNDIEFLKEDEKINLIIEEYYDQRELYDNLLCDLKYRLLDKYKLRDK